MATAKTRINISVSKRMRDDLRALAKRDQEPLATKAVKLLAEALELEEDRAIESIIERRLKGRKKIRWVKDSDRLWK